MTNKAEMKENISYLLLSMIEYIKI